MDKVHSVLHILVSFTFFSVVGSQGYAAEWSFVGVTEIKNPPSANNKLYPTGQCGEHYADNSVLYVDGSLYIRASPRGSVSAYAKYVVDTQGRTITFSNIVSETERRVLFLTRDSRPSYRSKPIFRRGVDKKTDIKQVKIYGDDKSNIFMQEHLDTLQVHVANPDIFSVRTSSDSSTLVMIATENLKEKEPKKIAKATLGVFRGLDGDWSLRHTKTYVLKKSGRFHLASRRIGLHGVSPDGKHFLLQDAAVTFNPHKYLLYRIDDKAINLVETYEFESSDIGRYSFRAITTKYLIFDVVNEHHTDRELAFLDLSNGQELYRERYEDLLFDENIHITHIKELPDQSVAFAMRQWDEAHSHMSPGIYIFRPKDKYAWDWEITLAMAPDMFREFDWGMYCAVEIDENNVFWVVRNKSDASLSAIWIKSIK